MLPSGANLVAQVLSSELLPCPTTSASRSQPRNALAELDAEDNAAKGGINAYTPSRPVDIEHQISRDPIAHQKVELRKVLDEGYDMWTEKEKYKSLYLQQKRRLQAVVVREQEAKTVIAALREDRDWWIGRAKYYWNEAYCNQGKIEELEKEIRTLKNPKKKEEMVRKLGALLEEIADEDEQ